MSLSDVLRFPPLVIASNEELPKEVSLTPTAFASPEKKKNVFTVSYANRVSSSAAAPTLPPSRDDMAFQAYQVRLHRQRLHEAFVLKHEMAVASVLEKDKCSGVKMLLRAAAERDMALAEAQQYPKPVLHFMKTTWQAFLQQAKAFLSEPVTALVGSEEAAAVVPTVSRSTAAIEIISSIGVWFSGPNVSLPLRQYTVQVPEANGEYGGVMQTVIVVGLLSFSYSSYIMQLRSIAQQSVLAELAMVEEQLGTRCLFAPQLLITP